MLVGKIVVLFLNGVYVIGTSVWINKDAGEVNNSRRTRIKRLPVEPPTEHCPVSILVVTLLY